MRDTPMAVLVGLAVSLTASQVQAQAPPPGSDFQLNTFTPQTQRAPHLGRDARGNFVAVWQSVVPPPHNKVVFGRLFDRLGAARGAEFLVNTLTPGGQDLHDLAVDASGRFVVVTDRANPAVPGGEELLARRFDQSGAAAGPEFSVTSATALQGSADAAMDAAGNLVIVWDAGSEVRGRRWDAAGQPGAEFVVSTTMAPVHSPKVALAPGGGFVVAWAVQPPGRTDRDAVAQRLDAAGQRLGGEFLVSVDTSGYQDPHAIAFRDDGSFVVAWTNASASATRVVRGRIFDAAGGALSGDLALSSDVPEAQDPYMAPDTDGGFLAFFTSTVPMPPDFEPRARRFDAAGAPLAPSFTVPQTDAEFQSASAVAGRDGSFVLGWTGPIFGTTDDEVWARLLGHVPAGLESDVAAQQSNGNGVVEPGETVGIAPRWANANRAAGPLAGAAETLTGPPGATYTIVDAAADYGTPAAGDTASCLATGDCHAIAISRPAARPAAHWDAVLVERVSGFAVPARHAWPIHVGESFGDVPPASPFYRFVEAAFHNGVTGGCAGGLFCPGFETTREQIAVFLLRARHGPSYQPVCTGAAFADVPTQSPFCPFIEELFRRHIATGCGGGNYCPRLPVTRQEAAALTLATVAPGFTAPACGTPRFADVPAASPFCPAIEELARRGVLAGCGGGNFCPGAALARDQMAALVAGAFSLSLDP
jgi:hypothetical protein